MKFASVVAGALFAGVLVPGAGQAASIVTDYSTWLADVNGQYAETSTTGLPDATTPVPGFSLPYGTTVTLGNPSGDTVLQTYADWGLWSGTYTGQVIDTATNTTSSQTETLTFGGTPIYAFGMDVAPDVGLFSDGSETFTITLSDGSSTTVSGTYPAGTTQFIGFVGTGIASITVSAANNPDFAIGNFVSAPEPVSMSLLASGLAALGFVRRRRSGAAAHA